MINTELNKARQLLQPRVAQMPEPLVRPLVASIAFAGSGLVLVFAMIMGPGYDKPSRYKTSTAQTSHSAFEIIGTSHAVLHDEEAIRH